jgi:thiol:disulfide interchange protein DsbD
LQKDKPRHGTILVMQHFTWDLWRRLGAMALLALSLAGIRPVWAEDFLPVEQVFQLSVEPASPSGLVAHFKLAKGVYLYRERFNAKLTPEGADTPITQADWQLPDGDKKHDPTFDKVVEVYHHDVDATLRWTGGPAGQAVLTVGYQGCADAGLCYPPQKARFSLTLDTQGHVTAVKPLQGEGAGAQAAAGGGAVSGLLGQGGAGGASATGNSGSTAAQAAPPGSADDDRIGQALASGNWWSVVPVFFLAGLLLSLTPCVLPMVPILSSIIVGQRERVSRGRGFVLALSYAQGMALVYTALGVAAGLLGQGLAAYLQHPWVVLGFAAMMVLLALSMFGLYELQLPPAVQSWLGAGSNKLPGGKFVSVFAMGVVSALVVSPCVSAPLAGALLYISQTHDVWLGASALYALAWGMSMPLLLVGLSAGSLLPRAGAWMTGVKTLFGVLMLGMAVWVARPAWPYLQSLVGVQQASSHQSALPFQRVKSSAELDAALLRAAQAGQPVMLDFYADWCTSCLEMEHTTFRDPAVQQALQGVLLLQADVTVNNADDRALLSRFKLFGPPGIIFFDAQGREQVDARVVGFQKSLAFQASVARGLRR